MKVEERLDARIGSIAARSLKAEHLREALSLYAQHVHETTGGDEEKGEALVTDEHAADYFQRVAKANEHAAVPPPPPPKRTW